MILSDNDIRKMLGEGRMKIVPLDDGQIGPASVDLTLSDEWYFFKDEYSRKIVDLNETAFTEAYEMKKAKSITLKPGELCLGKTLEKITLPGDVMGKLEGRSRYARMGVIIHLTSALVQPGSDNRQVLEIVNLAPFPVKLHAGMRISQVVFERLESATGRPYAKFGQIARKQ
ncbi:MAG TPA: dCTP deaminase [Candidatus Bilamarchaeum sp.]|nr:dCTP deaminase [Candidatus Bilamarchaeum sp.]